MRVMFFSGVSMVRPMMSHDFRFYMTYSTVFSPVNTIIQTRRVLPDNQKKTLHIAEKAKYVTCNIPTEHLVLVEEKKTA